MQRDLQMQTKVHATINPHAVKKGLINSSLCMNACYESSLGNVYDVFARAHIVSDRLTSFTHDPY